MKQKKIVSKIQCCGSGMFNPDPNFSIPDPGSKRFRIPDPHQHQIKVLLTHKTVTKLSVHPGSKFFPSRIQGQKGAGSRTRIRNTGKMLLLPLTWPILLLLHTYAFPQVPNLTSKVQIENKGKGNQNWFRKYRSCCIRNQKLH